MGVEVRRMQVVQTLGDVRHETQLEGVVQFEVFILENILDRPAQITDIITSINAISSEGYRPLMDLRRDRKQTFRMSLDLLPCSNEEDLH